MPIVSMHPSMFFATARSLAALACLVAAPCHAAAPVIDMLPGIVKPARSAERSPSADGVLEALHYEEGQTAAAGATTAVVDRALAEASLRQAECEAQRSAAVRLASTRVDVAQKYLARIEQAFAKQAASELELDEARGRVDEAKASLAEAHEQLDAASKQLETARAQHAAHEVRSPFEGELVRVKARLGEMVQRAAPVAMVVDLQELHADLYVPTALIGQLTVGQRYTLSAEAPVTRDLQAKLIYREPLIDAATDTFRCRFTIDNSRRHLPAGFAVRLRYPSDTAIGSEPIAGVR